MIIPYDSKKIKKRISPKQKTILVGGCFDVLHYGHISFLKKASTLGNHLVIALEGDETIVLTKDRQVFHSQQQRAEILESLSFVDDVILLPTFKTDKDYFQLVEAIYPTVIAMTEGDPQYHNKMRQAAHVGGNTIVIPFEKGFSTTDLLKKYNSL